MILYLNSKDVPLNISTYQKEDNHILPNFVMKIIYKLFRYTYSCLFIQGINIFITCGPCKKQMWEILYYTKYRSDV